MGKLEPNTVLVALVKTKADWSIAVNEHWYRIPVDTAPPIVRDGKLTHIAFYFPKEFGDERYMVKWYAEITEITRHMRVELMPGEPMSPKAQEERYRIAFGELQALPRPIVRKRGRRILFIPTTLVKLHHATELNDLFNDSPLENTLWEQLKEKKVAAERQYYIEYDEAKFVLDFAIFCQQRPLAIECDGNTYHNSDARVQRDKSRDAVLHSNGWTVLRFTTDDVTKRLPVTMERVYKTINELGGEQLVSEPQGARYLRLRDDNQGRLFD